MVPGVGGQGGPAGKAPAVLSNRKSALQLRRALVFRFPA